MSTSVSSTEAETSCESLVEVESAFQFSREVEQDTNSPINERSTLSAIELESEVVSSAEMAFISTTDTKLNVILFVETILKSTIEKKSNIILPAEPALVTNIEVESNIISPMEPVLILTNEIESDVILPVTKESSSEPTTGLESVVNFLPETESTVILNENNPVSYKFPVVKKKKFRKIRKFFSRLHCIRRIEDD